MPSPRYKSIRSVQSCLLIIPFSFRTTHLGGLLLLSRSVLLDSLQPHGLYPPGFSVRGILQARILEWVAISFSQGIFLTQGSSPRLLSLPRCRQILYHWATVTVHNSHTPCAFPRGGWHHYCSAEKRWMILASDFCSACGWCDTSLTGAVAEVCLGWSEMVGPAGLCQSRTWAPRVLSESCRQFLPFNLGPSYLCSCLSHGSQSWLHFRITQGVFKNHWHSCPEMI